MTTRRPPMSLQGTLEVIDLSHASEEDAARTVIQEIRARRARYPHAANGPAVLLDVGRPAGGSGTHPGDGPGHDPRSPLGERGSEQVDGRHGAQPFSFADFGELLRHLSSPAPEAAPEQEQETTSEGAEHTTRVEAHAAIERFLAERLLVVEEDGGGKMMAAAMVGFGLGAAAMYLARRLRYAAPPSAHKARPRRQDPVSDADPAWQAQIDEIARRYSDTDDEQDDDETSPGE